LAAGAPGRKGAFRATLAVGKASTRKQVQRHLANPSWRSYLFVQ